MQRYYEVPTLKCGKILKPSLPNNLSKNDPPINLAVVKVNTKNIDMPCILINYSQNFAFSFFNSNPTINIVYRLIRKSSSSGDEVILDEWNYKVTEIIPTIVDDIDTIEPLVLNYCDCLSSTENKSFTYIVQLTELVTENTTFEILNQEMAGTVSCNSF